jgi:hypothetical protein
MGRTSPKIGHKESWNDKGTRGTFKALTERITHRRQLWKVRYNRKRSPDEHRPKGVFEMNENFGLHAN